jgi:hypothetical protein
VALRERFDDKWSTEKNKIKEVGGAPEPRVRCRIFGSRAVERSERGESREGRGGIGKTREAMRRGKEGTDSQRRRLRLLFRSIISIESKISRSCAPYVLKRACMCGRAEE